MKPKSSFTTSVHTIVRSILSGQTMTYKEVAAKAGRPKAFRAVGNILNKNYDPTIPCHRVVRSDGTTGGYNRGVDKKRRILAEEKGEKKGKGEKE
jgi:O-6-methylguanine DNA methyltransferase